MKTEHRLQVAVARYLRDALPEGAQFTSIDAGVFLHGNEQQRMNAWAQMKARGIQTGVLDLSIWWQGRYIAIELKTQDGKLTEAETRWMDGLRANGFHCHVARSVKEVELCLRAEGFPLRASADGIDLRLDLYGEPTVKKTKSSIPVVQKPRAKPSQIRKIEAIRRKTPF